MLFENSILLLLWIACTYAIVKIIFGLQLYFKTSADVLHEQLVRRLNEIVHRVQVEQQGDVYYWYDQDNRKFLAQGRTTEEIVDAIKARFPEHIFYFEESNHLICAKHNWEPVPAQLTDKSR